MADQGTFQDVLTAVDRWQRMGAEELLAGVRYDPYCKAYAQGRLLEVVEDVIGSDAGGKALGGLYRCPKCGRVYYEAYLIGAGGSEATAIGVQGMPAGLSTCPRDGQELEATAVVLGNDGRLTALFRCPKCKQAYSQVHERVQV